MPPRVPATVSQTTHALTLYFNGEVVGAVFGFNPDESRAVSEHYEFGGQDTGTTQWGKYPGTVFEKVPGNVSGQRIEVQRVDLYRKRFERLLRGQSLEETLAQQVAWFTVTAAWSTPTASDLALALPTYPTAPLERYNKLYEGCWFARLGRTLSTTDDRVVKASSTIEYTGTRYIPVTT